MPNAVRVLVCFAALFSRLLLAPISANATNGPLSGTALYRAEYTYDSAGNRTLAAVVERNGSQAAVPLEVLSGYDALQRLTSTEHKLFDSGTSSLVPRRLDTWNLDLLGNWVGGSGTTTPPGRLITDPSNANAVLGLVDVGVNARNEPSTSTIKGESSGGATTRSSAKTPCRSHTGASAKNEDPRSKIMGMS